MSTNSGSYTSTSTKNETGATTASSQIANQDNDDQGAFLVTKAVTSASSAPYASSSKNLSVIVADSALVSEKSSSSKDETNSNAQLVPLSSLIRSSLAPESTSFLSPYDGIGWLDRANLPQMYHSMSSICSDDDPWKASSIGIKCISYQPVGYVFLTRRVLDLNVTDGQRKIEVVYNYSKKYRSKIKIPSIGSSMQNCSFCDTITLDFDPGSTLLDLVMEVQIITQGATLERHLKVSTMPSKDHAEEREIYDEKQIVKRFGEPDAAAQGEEDEEYNEVTTIRSNYDYKYLKTTTLHINDDAVSCNQKDNFELPKSHCHLEKLDELDEEPAETCDTQKITIRTIIKSDFNSTKNAGYDSTPNVGQVEDEFGFDSRRLLDSDRSRKCKSMSPSPSYTFITPLSQSSSRCNNYNSNSKRGLSPEESIRKSISSRSIVTTVEFSPPVPNIVESFDIENEEKEKKKFFDEFNKLYETDSQYDETSSTQNFSTDDEMAASAQAAAFSTVETTALDGDLKLAESPREIEISFKLNDQEKARFQTVSHSNQVSETIELADNKITIDAAKEAANTKLETISKSNLTVQKEETTNKVENYVISMESSIKPIEVLKSEVNESEKQTTEAIGDAEPRDEGLQQRLAHDKKSINTDETYHLDNLVYEMRLTKSCETANAIDYDHESNYAQENNQNLAMIIKKDRLTELAEEAINYANNSFNQENAEIKTTEITNASANAMNKEEDSQMQESGEQVDAVRETSGTLTTSNESEKARMTSQDAESWSKQDAGAQLQEDKSDSQSKSDSNLVSSNPEGLEAFQSENEIVRIISESVTIEYNEILTKVEYETVETKRKQSASVQIQETNASQDANTQPIAESTSVVVGLEEESRTEDMSTSEDTASVETVIRANLRTQETLEESEVDELNQTVDSIGSADSDFTFEESSVEVSGDVLAIQEPSTPIDSTQSHPTSEYIELEDSNASTKRQLETAQEAETSANSAQSNQIESSNLENDENASAEVSGTRLEEESVKQVTTTEELSPVETSEVEEADIAAIVKAIEDVTAENNQASSTDIDAEVSEGIENLRNVMKSVLDTANVSNSTVEENDQHSTLTQIVEEASELVNPKIIKKVAEVYRGSNDNAESQLDLAGTDQLLSNLVQVVKEVQHADESLAQLESDIEQCSQIEPIEPTLTAQENAVEEKVLPIEEGPQVEEVSVVTFEEEPEVEQNAAEQAQLEKDEMVQEKAPTEIHVDSTSLLQEAVIIEPIDNTDPDLEVNDLIEEVPAVSHDVEEVETTTEQSNLTQNQGSIEIDTRTTTENDTIQQATSEAPVESELNEVTQNESQPIADQFLEDTPQHHEMTQDEQAPSESELTRDVGELSSQEHTESIAQVAGSELDQNTKIEPSVVVSSIENGEELTVIESQVAGEKDVTSDLESSFEQSIANLPDTSFSTDQSDNFSNILTSSVISVQSLNEDLLDKEKRSDETSTTNTSIAKADNQSVETSTIHLEDSKSTQAEVEAKDQKITEFLEAIVDKVRPENSTSLLNAEEFTSKTEIISETTVNSLKSEAERMLTFETNIIDAALDSIINKTPEEKDSSQKFLQSELIQKAKNVLTDLIESTLVQAPDSEIFTNESAQTSDVDAPEESDKESDQPVVKAGSIFEESARDVQNQNVREDIYSDDNSSLESELITEIKTITQLISSVNKETSPDLDLSTDYVATSSEKQHSEIVEAETSKQESENAVALADEKSNQDGAVESAAASQVASKAQDQVVFEQEVIYDVVKEISAINPDEANIELEPRIEEPEDDATVDNFFSTITDLISKQEQQSVLHSSSESEATQESCFLDEDKPDVLEESFDSTADQGAPKPKGYDAYDDLDELIKETNSKQGSKIVSGKAANGQTRSQDFGVPQNSTLSGSSQFSSENPSLNKKDPSMENISGAEDLKMNLKDSSLEEICKDFERWQDQNASLGSMENIEVPDDLNHSETSSEGHGSEMMEAESTISITQTKSTLIEQASEQFEDQQANDQLRLEPAVEPIKDLALGIDEHLVVSNQLDEIVKLAQELVTSDNINQIVAEIRQATEQALNEIHTEFDSDNAEDAEMLPEDASILVPTRSTLSQEQEHTLIFNKAVIEEQQPLTESDSSSVQESPVILAQEQDAQKVEEIISDADQEIAETSAELSTESADSVVMVKTADESILHQVTEEEISLKAQDQAAEVEDVSSGSAQETTTIISSANIENVTTTSISEPIVTYPPENTQQHEIQVEEIASLQEPTIESGLLTNDNQDESSDEQTQSITVEVPEDESMPGEELAESKQVAEETTTQLSKNITDPNDEDLDQQLSLNSTAQPREESQLSGTDEESIQTTVEAASETVAQESLISNESDSAELADTVEITEEPEIREESQAEITSLEQNEALSTEPENSTALNLEMNGLAENVPSVQHDVEPTTSIQPQESTEIVTTETTTTIGAITEHQPAISEIPTESNLSEVSQQQAVEQRSSEQQIMSNESRAIADQLQEEAQQLPQATRDEQAPTQSEFTTSVQELPTHEEINAAIEEQAESITTEESVPAELEEAQTTEQLSENTQQLEQEIHIEPEPSRTESELATSTQSQLFSGQQTVMDGSGEEQASEPQETREKEVTSDFESSFEQSIMNAHETSSIIDSMSELKISVNSDHLDDSAIHSISSYTENLQPRLDLREENEVQRSGSLLQEQLPEASTHVPEIPEILQKQQSTQEEIQYESQTNVGSTQIQAETVQDLVSPEIYDVSSSEEAVDEEFNTKMESAYLQSSIEDGAPSLNQVQIPNKEEEADEQEFINKFADNEDKSKSLEDTSAILDQSKYLTVLDSDEISIPLNVKNSTQTPQKTEGETISLDAPSMNIASSLQEWNFLDNQAPVKIEALPISETDTESLYSENTSERHQSARDDENERSAETSTISFSNILSAFALPKAPTPPNADQDQWDNFTQFGFIDFSKEEYSPKQENRKTDSERLELVETDSSSIMPEPGNDLARFDIHKPWINELNESVVQKAKHAEEFDAYNNEFPVADPASGDQEQTVEQENLSTENARSLVSIIRSVQLPAAFSARGEQNTDADENNQTPSTFDFIEFNPKQQLEDQTGDDDVFKQDVALLASSETSKALVKVDRDPAAFDAYAPWTNDYNNYQEKAPKTVHAEEFDAFNSEFPTASTSVEEAPTEEARALQVTLPDIRQLIRYLPRLPAIREANESDQTQEPAQSAFSFIEFNKEQESVPTAEAAYNNHDNEAQILSLNQAKEHADVLAVFDKYSAWNNNNLNYADEIKGVKHTEEFDAYNNEFPVASTETEIIQNEEAQSTATQQSALNLTSIIDLIRLPHATAGENSGVEDLQVLEEGSESALFDFIDFNPNATYDAKPIVIEEMKEMPLIKDSAVFDQTNPWTNEYNNYFEKVKTTTHSAEFDAFNNEFPVIDTNAVDNLEEIPRESSGFAISLTGIMRSVQLPIFAARDNQVAEISSEAQMPSTFDFIEFNPKQQLEDQTGDDDVFKQDVALLASSETSKALVKVDRDPAAFDAYAPWTSDYNNYQEKFKKTKYAEEFDAFNAEFPSASDHLEESNPDANTDLENSRTLTSIISSVRLPPLFSARQDPAVENNAAEQSSTFDYIEFASKQQGVSSDEVPFSQVEPIIKSNADQSKLERNGDLATFDAFSQWNNEYTQYQSSAKKSKFNEEFDPFNNNFEVNQSMNETVDQELVTASAEIPSQSVFSSIITKIRASASTTNEQAKPNFGYLEFEPKNDQIQTSEEADSAEQDLDSIDYSQFKVVPLPTQREVPYNSLFSKSDNPADFATNKLKPDYFKLERLTEDELRLRSTKADKDPAAFDAYAPWTNEYNDYKDKAKKTVHTEEFDAFNNDFSVVTPKEPRDLAEEQRQRATASNQTNLFSFFRLPRIPFPSIIPRNTNTQENQAGSNEFEHIVFDSQQQAMPREPTVEEKVVVKTSRDPAVFDANLPWTNEYSGYEASIRKSKHAAEFDAYNNEFPVAESVEQQQIAQEDISTSENARSTMSIFRFVRWPVFAARENQAAETVLESGVPSTFDFIEFNPKQQLEDQTGDDDVFKQDVVLSASSDTNKMLESVNKDPAAFDAYAPWTNDYNNYQEKAKRNKHAEEFDPFNSEFPVVTEARKNENELLLDDPRRIFTVTNLFRVIGRSLRTRQPPTNRADRIEESDSQEIQSKSIDVLTQETNNNSRLNRLLSDFKLRDLVDFNSFYQDAFVRPTFCVDNSGVSRFYIEPSSPLFNNFSLIDLVRFQNLTKIKPYFDDFATFPNQYYEYTRYHLITNPDKYDYYKSITRSGQPFFFVHDHHKVLEDSKENNRPSTNLLGYAIISMGALSLLSYTFV